jgi:hypothetical protein
VLADLEALTPPLVVGGAFLIAVGMFLRRQMSPRRRPGDDGGDADIQGRAPNAHPGDPADGPSADQHKV